MSALAHWAKQTKDQGVVEQKAMCGSTSLQDNSERTSSVHVSPVPVTTQ
ncbi:hypothetical protein BIW11_11632, partial [Tropilaelaps mercedesae]